MREDSVTKESDTHTPVPMADKTGPSVAVDDVDIHPSFVEPDSPNHVARTTPVNKTYVEQERTGNGDKV